MTGKCEARLAEVTSGLAVPSVLRADLDTGRGDFDSARAHLNSVRETMRADHGFGIFEASVADELRTSAPVRGIQLGPWLPRSDPRVVGKFVSGRDRAGPRIGSALRSG